MWRRLWCSLVTHIANVSLSTFFGYRALWRGRVPARGGVLLVSNHQSYLDPALVAAGVPRMMSFMARRTLFRNPLFRWLIASTNAFPISREGRDTAAMREAIRRLEAGEALLVFPEGTRTRDGTVGRMRAGVDLLARRARVPVVPVAIDGAFEAWPKHAKGMTFHHIRVGFGPRIEAAEVARMSRSELRQRVRKDIVALLGELRSLRAAGEFVRSL